MSSRNSIKVRRLRHRINQSFDLQLTSMMDVLVIIVVFLLKSYSASVSTFDPAAGLTLPVSASQDIPEESLQVVVTPEAITFENERILDFVLSSGSVGSTEAVYKFKDSDLDEGKRLILPLYDALVKARNKAELIRNKYRKKDEQGSQVAGSAGTPDSKVSAQGAIMPFDGIIAIQADKKIQYATLRKIMYTAGSAGYRIFRFLASKREGAS